MGLDMYLLAEKYVGRWAHDPSTHPEFDAIVEALEMQDFVTEDSPSMTVSITIGYWRKANAIHNWFVQNVQGGVDECREAYVSREKLCELRETCLRVLASTGLVEGIVRNGQLATADGWQDILEDGRKMDDPTIAEELLPGSSGFFFGSTDYNERYYGEIERTVEVIDKALTLPATVSIHYHSSW